MTKSELIHALQDVPDYAEVLLATDPGGSEVHALAEVDPVLEVNPDAQAVVLYPSKAVIQ